MSAVCIHLGQRPSAALCPDSTRARIDDYVTHGRGVGGFLRAVLENDLMHAVQFADDENLVALPHIVAYITDRVPVRAWGSERAVTAHLATMKSTTEKMHDSPDCYCSTRRGRRHSGICGKCIAAGCAMTSFTQPCKLTGEVLP